MKTDTGALCNPDLGGGGYPDGIREASVEICAADLDGDEQAGPNTSSGNGASMPGRAARFSSAPPALAALILPAQESGRDRPNTIPGWASDQAAIQIARGAKAINEANGNAGTALKFWNSYQADISAPPPSTNPAAPLRTQPNNYLGRGFGPNVATTARQSVSTAVTNFILNKVVEHGNGGNPLPGGGLPLDPVGSRVWAGEIAAGVASVLNQPFSCDGAVCTSGPPPPVETFGLELTEVTLDTVILETFSPSFGPGPVAVDVSASLIGEATQVQLAPLAELWQPSVSETTIDPDVPIEGDCPDSNGSAFGDLGAAICESVGGAVDELTDP